MEWKPDASKNSKKFPNMFRSMAKMGIEKLSKRKERTSSLSRMSMKRFAIQGNNGKRRKRRENYKDRSSAL